MSNFICPPKQSQRTHEKGHKHKHVDTFKIKSKCFELLQKKSIEQISKMNMINQIRFIIDMKNEKRIFPFFVFWNNLYVRHTYTQTHTNKVLN